MFSGRPDHGLLSWPLLCISLRPARGPRKENRAMDIHHRRNFLLGAAAGLVCAGREVVQVPAPSAGPSTGSSAGSPTAAGQAATRTPTKPVDPQTAARLRQVMVPLLQNMNKPLPLNQVRVGILPDSHINAANGGGGEF